MKRTLLVLIIVLAAVLSGCGGSGNGSGGKSPVISGVRFPSNATAAFTSSSLSRNSALRTSYTTQADSSLADISLLYTLSRDGSMQEAIFKDKDNNSYRVEVSDLRDVGAGWFYAQLNTFTEFVNGTEQGEIYHSSASVLISLATGKIYKLPWYLSEDNFIQVMQDNAYVVYGRTLYHLNINTMMYKQITDSSYDSLSREYGTFVFTDGTFLGTVGRVNYAIAPVAYNPATDENLFIPNIISIALENDLFDGAIANKSFYESEPRGVFISPSTDKIYTLSVARFASGSGSAYTSGIQEWYFNGKTLTPVSKHIIYKDLIVARSSIDPKQSQVALLYDGGFYMLTFESDEPSLQQNSWNFSGYPQGTDAVFAGQRGVSLD